MSRAEGGRPSDFRSLLERVLAEVAEAHEQEVEALQATPALKQRRSLPPKLAPMGPKGPRDRSPSSAAESGNSQPEAACGEASAPDGAFCSILPGALGGPSPPPDEHAKSQPVGRVKNAGDVQRISSRLSLGLEWEGSLQGRLDRAGTVANLALKEAQDDGLLATPSKRSGWSAFSASSNESGEQSATLKWQWLHRTGWRDYKQQEAAQLENMFQGGYNKARLKSGKRGHHPMEIFFADMIQHDAQTRKVRSVRRLGPDPVWRRLLRFLLSFYRPWGTGRPRMESFEQFYGPDIQQCQIKDWFGEGGDLLKRSHSTLDEASNCVQRRCQRIAGSRAFACITTAMLVINALWLAVEADRNEAHYLLDADVSFRVIENFFCVVFTVEIMVRFLAFARKRDAFVDRLFAFDCVCTIALILETWLIRFLTDTSFGLFQLARLLRVSRVGRLVLKVPGLVVLLKGLQRSLRSVMVTTFLLGVLIVLLAIVFRTQVKHSWLGRCCWEEDTCPRCDGYFHSMPNTILTLFFNGTLLDSVKKVLDNIRSESFFLTVVFVVHVLFTHCVMLNTLIGIVCGVVAEVKKMEEERTDKFSLMWRLSDLMQIYDLDGNSKLSMDEIGLMFTSPEVKRVLTEFQVDVWGLRTFMEIYAASVAESSLEKGEEACPEFPFGEILDIVLRLRGGGGASVADIVNLRRFTGRRIDSFESKVTDGMINDA